MFERSRTDGNSSTINSPIRESMDKKKYCEERMTIESDQKPYRIFTFPVIVGVISFVYWFAFCPLIWASLYHAVMSEKWPLKWPYYFWITAILIWLLIMAISVIIWRRRRNRNNESKEAESSKYISEPYPVNTLETRKLPESINMYEIEKPVGASPIPSRHMKQGRMVLPPLIIHQNMGGQSSNENSGDVTIAHKSTDEVDEEIPESANPNRISQNMARSSIKEYLKIVTVESPSPDKKEEEDGVDSPARPLSPRELFFIDLIRQADKSGSSQPRPYRGSYFFGDRDRGLESTHDTRRYTMGGSEFRKLLSTDAKQMEELKKASRENIKKSVTEIPEVVEEKADTSSDKLQEPEYFIASVSKPELKKAEVFLRVESDVDAATVETQKKSVETTVNIKEDTKVEKTDENLQ